MSSFYERYRRKRLSDPKFREHYERHRAEIESIDAILSIIESRREELGLTKADLARLIGKRPEAVRRIFSGHLANPTLSTVLEMTEALGMEVTVKPNVPKKEQAEATKRAARELGPVSA